MGQQKVHASSKRIKVCRGGRRWGKGRVAVFEAIYVMRLLATMARPASIVPHHRLWVVGPSFSELDQAWEEIDAYLPKELETRLPLLDEKTRFLANDGRLQFKSADNSPSLQNVGLDWVWITEAHDIEDSVWWNQISPMLHSPGVLGWAFIEGKAPKPGSWYEALWELGQDPDNEDIESWWFHTEDNPHVDWDAILRTDGETMPEEKFREEYYADAPTEYGKAFNSEAIDLCIAGRLETPLLGVKYAIGTDLGKMVDPTVAIVMRKAQKRVVGFERLLRTDWTVQEGILTDLAKTWNDADMYVDETGLGGPVCDGLRKSGVKIHGINMTRQKNDLMNKLAAGIEKEQVRFPNVPVLIKEMKQMRRIKKDKYGQDLRVEKIIAPRGQHDDCPVALALAFHGCRGGGDFTPIKPRNRMRSA